MDNKVGYILREIRESEMRTVKNTARGIMSVSELSKLENGEKDVGYLILEALFETLGKSIDKLELAISQKEFDLLVLREKIENALEQQKVDEAEDLIKVYEKRSDIHKTIHLQYLKGIKALNDFNRTHNRQETLERLKEALAVTYHEDTMPCVYLFHQEIRFIYMMHYLVLESDGGSEIIQNIKKLEHYITHFYTDQEAKVKIYPQCTWLLGKMYYLEGEYRKCNTIVDRGIQCLRENGGLHWMRELLWLKKECARKLYKEDVVKQCEKYVRAIDFLYDIAGMKAPEFSVAKFLESNTQRECIVSNKFLRDLRKVKNITQEELCENVCTWETISRVEAGRTPNKKKLYQLWKKLGVQRERCYAFIEAEHYSTYEKVREFHIAAGKHNDEKAQEIFDELKEELDSASCLNRQYIRTIEIMYAVKNNELSEENAIKQLWELLYITMPVIDKNETIYRMPFRTEFLILNQIARCYDRVEKKIKALEIYRNILQQYKMNGTDMRHHVVPGIILYVNLAACLEELNQLSEAAETAMEGLYFSINCKRGDTAGEILANMSCIYEKNNDKVHEELFLKYSYYSNILYKNDALAKMINEAYEGTFGKIIS